MLLLLLCEREAAGSGLATHCLPGSAEERQEREGEEKTVVLLLQSYIYIRFYALTRSCDVPCVRCVCVYVLRHQDIACSHLDHFIGQVTQGIKV